MNSIEKAIERLMKQSARGNPATVGKPVARAVEPTDIALNSKNDRCIKFDFSMLEKIGYMTPHDTNNSLAEEFRLIKRPLLRNIAGRGADDIEHANLIMLTSSLPNEGKTFMTLNLALSMVAEKDNTVLLIDSDVVNPSLSRMLGLESKPGLTEILNDPNVNVEDVMYDTDIPNLRFIPAGNLDAYSTELLASEKMRLLTRELSERYQDRIILFDSPPLLVASQAAVLSHLIGQIMIVVEAGKTPQNLVTEALNMLDENDVIGIVLNKNRSSSLSGYYYGSKYNVKQ